MRGTRRRLLDIACVIFLISAVARVVFLITGLRTYATRPEIPFRIIEIVMLVLAAAFTYYISYRFGFAAMTAACLLALYAPIKELITGSRATIGYVYPELDVDGYIFDILLIIGCLLLAAVSVMTNPRFPRDKSKRSLLRILSFVVMLIFAACLVYRVVLLSTALYLETFPGEYTTKYFYVTIATDVGLIMTGRACLVTAAIRPSKRHHSSEEHAETTA